jgi:valyl-tRNA synthetase
MKKFADYYIEFVKYRLYGENQKSKASAIYTLNIVLKDILKMFAPIIPFVTEEIYSLLGEKESIHISQWPKEKEINQSLDISDFDKAIEAINEVRKHKSENKISLGAEIDEYKLNTEVNLEKYKDFISKAIKVKNLS